MLDGRNAFVADGVQRALGREPTGVTAFAGRGRGGDRMTLLPSVAVVLAMPGAVLIGGGLQPWM
ncbi:hypothetical protein [Halomonas ventosae]|uniref:hypothetical protein n=1 Tax=Halomonas ventosae TaxID=229007 RepID=UPI001AADCBB9|nr:hypothetical protein [Halomonas ventosae]